MTGIHDLSSCGDGTASQDALAATAMTFSMGVWCCVGGCLESGGDQYLGSSDA